MSIFITTRLRGPLTEVSKRASWWLKPADRELALERLERWSRKAPRGANLTAIRKMLFNPILYHLALIYIGFLLSGWGSSCE